ncbi:MAG: type II secretion system GspH family protein [Patescibacteria group bacterium]|nr:type II secretion system GspH family protein [Patescibacteria group bacterium]
MKYLSKIKSSKGFTLIELLVVIGILGILAAALVATIDPFEQLKKASDSNIKNALVEYLNANVRYYTTHNAYPWDTVVNGGAACNGATAPTGLVALNAGNMPSCTTALTGEKELKSAFGTATSVLKEIFIKYDATANVVSGCFKPGSTSQQKSKETKYTDSAGTPDAGNTCISNGGATNCYWCTQ